MSMTGIQKKCAVQQSYCVHFSDFDVYLFNSYVEFVDSSSKLNDSENYPQLMAMCKTSGVRVTKVVFRGYFAAPKIQASHDQAISRRTDLQLKVCCSQILCGTVFFYSFPVLWYVIDAKYARWAC